MDQKGPLEARQRARFSSEKRRTREAENQVGICGIALTMEAGGSERTLTALQVSKGGALGLNFCKLGSTLA